jgi:hypothetical protein
VKFKAAAFCAVVFIGAAPVDPVGAQYLDDNRPSERDQYRPLDVLPPHEIAAIVRSRNLEPVSRPIWINRYYLVRAENFNGEIVRVVVDARTGRITATDTAREVPRRFGIYSRFGRLAPDPGDVEPRIPPRSVPNARRLAPEPRSAAITPATPVKPPLPRPRPAAPAAAAVSPPEPSAQIVPPAATPPTDTTGSSNPTPSFPPAAPLE